MNIWGNIICRNFTTPHHTLSLVFYIANISLEENGNGLQVEQAWLSCIEMLYRLLILAAAKHFIFFLLFINL